VSQHRTGFREGVSEVGAAALLGVRFFRTLFTTRFEGKAFVSQIYLLGVKSMVMTIQFGFFMEKYGAKEALGKVIALSMARELAPALTSLVVGMRIAAGMAAELGSMAVTEQIDAIRALGANPVHKLVVPRVLASVLIMPLIACIALLLGMSASLFIGTTSYGIPASQYIGSALDGVTMQDYLSGLSKAPFFGFLVAVLGCHFGMSTRGGTEGVGRSTTRSVVAVSIAILIADALLTQLFVSF
jgi:phospholipid/cholesterol/gamma-HCH transport system permease protein